MGWINQQLNFPINVKHLTTPEVTFITSSLCAIFNPPTSPYIIILGKQKLKTHTPFLQTKLSPFGIARPHTLDS